MSKTLVTVVLVNWNGVDILLSALNSLHSQAYKNFNTDAVTQPLLFQEKFITKVMDFKLVSLCIMRISTYVVRYMVSYIG